MNTSAVHYSSETWSRRCSIESILSIQGKETDFVVDSSDTEICTDQELEYEPCTEPEDAPPLGDLGDSSGESANEIISTKVIAVSVRDDGDLEFADSEQTDTEGFDSEVDLCDYWRCAQCGASNNNPMYRYCERCYKVRKNFFPPRPKRKNKRKLSDKKDKRPLSPDSDDERRGQDRLPTLALNNVDKELPLFQENAKKEQSSLPQENNEQTTELGSLSQESTTLSQNFDSQRTLSQDSGFGSQELTDPQQGCSGLFKETVVSEISLSSNIKSGTKRQAESLDRAAKRIKTDVSSESDSDNNDTKVVSPLLKTVSDPSLTVEEVKVTKRILTDTAKEIDKDNNMCIICLSEPKSGVFVHGRIAHICCCYKCAVKVWAKAKRCPVCNCKVSNVLRAVVM